MHAGQASPVLRRRLRLLSPLLVLLLAPIAAMGQEHEPVHVLRSTLDNGLRVIIVQNDLAPVVTTEINYLAGSNEAPDSLPGTAHALEHMMFRGSQDLSADQLADISAFMGGDFNADTQQTVTQYFFTVPSEHLDIALHIEALRMKSLLCVDSLWTQERGAIEQEVSEDISNPEYLVYTQFLDALFHGTPYAHDALGTRPSFEQTTAQMLRQFHDTWYAPNNAILVIVGDVEPDKALAQVKAIFGGIAPHTLPARATVSLRPAAPETLRSPTDLPYGFVVVSFQMPGTNSPDYAAAQILSDVLGSQRGDLYGLVPQGKALFTGFQTSGLPEAGLSLAFAAFPKGADPTALTGEVQGAISGYVKDGLPADLVEAAKRHEIAANELAKNSIAGLANAWSGAVAVDGKDSPDAELVALEAVQLDDVNRAARKYLDFDHAIWAVMTPQESGKPVSSSSFGGSESFAPQNPQAVELPDWARNAIRELNIPASVVNPTVYNLANGIRLIVQRETISNTVGLYGRIKHNADLQTPAGKEGVGRLLDNLFEYGTTTLDRLAFQKALDDIGANENAGTSFALEVQTRDVERGVELLADNLLHPALPQEAFAVVQTQTAETVAGELQSPDYLTNRALTKALVPGDDPTLRETTPETVRALTLDDVKAYHATVFRPDLTTIVMIGDIAPGDARALIEKHFGDWKAAGPKPETELAPIPMNRASAVGVPDQSKVQDAVTLAVNLGITRSDPDYYALELGNQVLGGSFYATRLFKDLRENKGLVYYVSSDFNVGKHRSTYQVRYGCDPGKVASARSIIERDLTQMQKTAVSKDELDQAKAIALRDIQLSESGTAGIAHGLLGRSLADLPLDEPTVAAKKYIKLSAAEIESAYAKWLHIDHLAQVIEGP